MNHSLTKKLIIFSTGWNFIGNFIPLIVGLFAIPLLIKGMGTDRFGLLTLLWMGLGYFSVFDFGLGRALTKFVSEKANNFENKADIQIIWTALIVLSVIGLLFSIFLLVFSDPLLEKLLPTSSIIQDEGLISLRLLALGIPIVSLSAGLIGILEGFQSFKIIALIRMPLGVMTFLAPLITLQFTENIGWIVFSLLICRLLALFAFLYALLAQKPLLLRFFSLSLTGIKPLVAFGGWVTVSNIIAPLLTYLDRFYIGPFLGLANLAYYTVPYDILIRLQIVPQSIMGAIFPTMVENKNSNINKYEKIYKVAGKIAFYTMLPAISFIFLLAPEWLTFWLGDDFSEKSCVVVKILCIGWLVNLTAQNGILSIIGDGRPDLISKLYLVEIAPYLFLLLYLSEKFGINGVAAAWAIRVSSDAFIVNLLVYARSYHLRGAVTHSFFIIFLIGVFSLVLWNIDGIFIKATILLSISIISLVIILNLLGVNFYKKKSTIKN